MAVRFVRIGSAPDAKERCGMIALLIEEESCRMMNSYNLKIMSVMFFSVNEIKT